MRDAKQFVILRRADCVLGRRPQKSGERKYETHSTSNDPGLVRAAPTLAASALTPSSAAAYWRMPNIAKLTEPRRWSEKTADGRVFAERTGFLCYPGHSPNADRKVI